MNELNEFNTGNSHEMNPLGGIPLGVGQNGQINTVEENETMKGDFIYSDRIVFTPEIVSQFNLPKSLSNKTAAEASKIINNKFEGRNDKITTSTKKSMLDKVAQAQETIKQAKAQEIAAAQQMNSTEVPDMMGGQIPAGMEEFIPQEQMALGGFKDSQFGAGLQEGATNEQMMGSIGAGINTLTAGLNLGQTAFGKTGIDKSGATDVDPGSIKPGMSGVQGALAGAATGSMFGPLGTGIGGAIGLGAGLIGGLKAKKDALRAHQNFEIGQSNNKISNFAMGGNMYAGGGPLKPWQQPYFTMYDDPNYSSGFGRKEFVGAPYATELPEDQRVNVNYTPVKSFYKESFNQMQKPQLSNNIGFESKLNYNEPVSEPTVRTFGPQGGHSNYAELKNVKDKVGEQLNKAGEFIKDNKGVLRYAPVAMNAFQLHKLNKEGYDTVNPIINNTRYNPQYMDERALTNQINAESNYTGNALANASNGSLGALSNSILASQLNKTRALSDAYSKVADVNRNENKAGQQFNLSVDEANIGRRIAAEDKTAMNKGAFKTEQSKLRGQIGTDLGEIGKEETYKEMAKKLYGYDFNGKYYVAPDGTKKTTQEMADMIDNDRDAKNNKTTFRTNKFNPMNFEDGIVFKSKYTK